MANFDDVIIAASALSRGNVVVKLVDDTLGVQYPTFLYRMPKMKNSELYAGGDENTHPAWIVDGVEKTEFLFSCYINSVMNGKALSLPMSDPKVYTNFDQAKAYAEACGTGYHLPTIAEYAAIALWCRKNGLMPRGNNNYGKDHSAPYEVGTPTYMEGANVCRTATGSGPASWNHNGKPYGIADLNGNVYEWQAGYRTMDGEIQIIADNNAAVTGTNQLATSTLWKAIMPDGSLVTPGTAGALKWDYVSAAATDAPFRLNTVIENVAADDTPYGQNLFNTLAAKDGVNIPEIMKKLTLMPVDSGDHGGDRVYMRNRGECLGFRGGRWHIASSAGVFYMYGYLPRSSSYSYIGFRSALII